jgi:hypothetical protein
MGPAFDSRLMQVHIDLFLRFQFVDASYVSLALGVLFAPGVLGTTVRIGRQGQLRHVTRRHGCTPRRTSIFVLHCTSSR